MKTGLILFFGSILAFILLTGFISAQAQNILVGIKAGPQYSSLFGITDRLQVVRPLLGWHAGLNLNFKLGSRFSLQPGIELSKKGYTMQYQTYGLLLPNLPEIQIKTIYYYFDLPILLNFTFAKKFRAGVGLTSSIFLSQKNIINNQGYYVDGGNNKNYLSALVSLGYQIKRLETGLRYSTAFWGYGQNNYPQMLLVQLYCTFHINKIAP